MRGAGGVMKCERLFWKVVFALTLTLSPRRGNTCADPRHRRGDKPPRHFREGCGLASRTGAPATPSPLRERAGVRGAGGVMKCERLFWKVVFALTLTLSPRRGDTCADRRHRRGDTCADPRPGRGDTCADPRHRRGDKRPRHLRGCKPPSIAG